MGRKSKLSDEQWAEVGRRLIEGGSARALGREYGVSEASIREHFEKIGKTATVQKVAHMIVDTENALKALPETAQVSAQNLAARLRSISDSLASAADLGAKTAHRLNALANSEVEKVDDAEPLKSLEALKGVALLTKLANSSADIAVSLLTANKETIKRINEEGDDGPEELTPDRIQEGVRRVAFMLHRAAQEPAHG